MLQKRLTITVPSPTSIAMRAPTLPSSSTPTKKHDHRNPLDGESVLVQCKKQVRSVVRLRTAPAFFYIDSARGSSYCIKMKVQILYNFQFKLPRYFSASISSSPIFILHFLNPTAPKSLSTIIALLYLALVTAT